MQLEDLTAEVRPRSHWEAADLGFALVRRHFPKLLAGWLLCVGPLWEGRMQRGTGLFFVWDWFRSLVERSHLSCSLIVA